MAVYLPEDQRWGMVGKGLGSGIGSILQGYLSANRQREVANYLQEHPEASAAELYPLARGDPATHDLITSILHGRLEQAQLTESKARAQKEVAQGEQARATALLDVTKTLTEQINQSQAGLKAKVLEAEINEKNAAATGKLAEAAKYRLEGENLKIQIKTAEAMLPLIQQMTAQYGIGATAPTPQDTQPPGTLPGGSATKAPEQAGYPEGSPDFVTKLDGNVKRMRDFQKSPQGQGLTMSMRAGAVTLNQQHDKVSPTEEGNQDALLSLAQALGSINDALVKDKKTGQLRLGPISGRIGQVFAQFAKNPQDVNAALGVLTGHADITAGSLLPRTRQGYQLLELLKDILVTPKKGLAFNYNALRNSMRIIVAEATGISENQLGRKALGMNPDGLEEISRIARQTFKAGPSDVATGRRGAAAPSEPGAPAAPSQGAPTAYDPKRTYDKVGETFTINGKTYRVMKLDPKDPANPDIEEVK